MLSTWPRIVIVLPGGSFGAVLGHDRCRSSRGDAAEVAALHVGVDVEHRLDVGVVDDLRRHAAARPWPRSPSSCGSAGRRRRQRQSFDERVDASRPCACGVCTVDEVGDAVAADRPSSSAAPAPLPDSDTSTLLATSCCVRPSSRGPRLVDVDVQLRHVDHLVQVHVDRAADPARIRAAISRRDRRSSACWSKPGDLHVDRRRQAEVQDLADDVGRLEVERQLRKLARQLSRSVCDVLRRRLVALGASARRGSRRRAGPVVALSPKARL